MRNRVIPAQITTVEDKIVGNLSLTQIILLLVPVLITTFIYTFLPPTMTFVVYKLTLASIFSVFSMALAIRVKGRIIASWIIVLSTYNLRPKYYVYNKNSVAFRTIIKPKLLKIKSSDDSIIKRMNEEKIYLPNIKDILQLNHILDTTDFNLTYRAGRKGGLNVAFEKISK
jgi:hypothetical protein